MFHFFGLPQIADRRKLVSSIKSSVINQENDKVSYKGRGNGSVNLDPVSSSRSTVDDHSSSIPSRNHASSTVDEVAETLPSDIGSGFDEVKNEYGKLELLRKASSEEDTSKQSEDTNSEAVWLEGLPSFLSSSSESSTEVDENRRLLNKTFLTEMDGEANDPVIEDVIPPPLAGANVMNVVLVAAECAPWSKTGIVALATSTSFTRKNFHIYLS